MAIEPLPTPVSASLRSSQVVLDAVSVVKELVDNSLDAGARSIIVRVSSDLLNLIEVHDDGQGIDPEDYCRVALPHCTSKIRSLEDLRDLGGQSLGFRGEALASILHCSQTMTINTKVDNQPLASLLRLMPGADRAEPQKTSHPVGTTVRVSKLHHGYPVRQQHLKKDASKVLSRLKTLLQSYAMARPYARFALNVQGAAGSAASWDYVPKSGSDMAEALLQICGRTLLSRCQDYKWTTARGFVNTLDAPSNGEIQFSAILPSPSISTSSVPCGAQFVVLDARPMNLVRGLARDVVKLFRGIVRAYFGSTTINPVLVLNIHCAPGAYDTNVEIAKDDVLPTDREAFMAACQAFFEQVYVKNELIARAPLNAAKVCPAIIASSEASRQDSTATAIEADTPKQPTLRIDHTLIAHEPAADFDVTETLGSTSPLLMPGTPASIREADLFDQGFGLPLNTPGNCPVAIGGRPASANLYAREGLGKTSWSERPRNSWDSGKFKPKNERSSSFSTPTRIHANLQLPTPVTGCLKRVRNDNSSAQTEHILRPKRVNLDLSNSPTYERGLDKRQTTLVDAITIEPLQPRSKDVPQGQDQSSSVMMESEQIAQQLSGNSSPQTFMDVGTIKISILQLPISVAEVRDAFALFTSLDAYIATGFLALAKSEDLREIARGIAALSAVSSE